MSYINGGDDVPTEYISSPRCYEMTTAIWFILVFIYLDRFDLIRRQTFFF